MMAFAAIAICSSCGKGDDEKSVDKNPLAGTLWAEEGKEAPLYIEFIDNTKVRVWGARATDVVGTYRVSGNTITFSSVTTEIGLNTRVFKNGTFTNNTLMVNFTLAGAGVYSPQDITWYLYKK